MSTVVVDASCMVGVLWEGSELGDWFDDAELIAPSLFWAELANAALSKVRRGIGITLPLAQAGLWESMLMVSPAHAASAPVVLDLAYDTGLTAYDASYLANAIALSLPLATFDGKLRKAAADLGVVTLP